MGAQVAKKQNRGSLAKIGTSRFVLLNGLLFFFFMSLPLAFCSAFSASGQLYLTLYDLPKLYLGIGFSFLLFSFFCLNLGYDKVAATAAITFFKHNFGLKLLGLFFSGLILSLFQTLVPAAALLTLAHYFALFLLYFALACIFCNPVRRWFAVYGLSVALFVFTVPGIIQFYGYKIPFLLPILGPASTFGYRNPAAHFIALVLPFVFFAAGRHWRIWNRSKRPLQFAFFMAFMLLAAAALALLFMNYSRTAIMALLAEALVVPLFWFFSRRKAASTATRQSGGRLRLMMVGFLLLAVIISLIMVFPNSRNRVKSSINKFQQGGFSRLLEARYYHWGNSLMMIKDHPFLGVGLGNWRFSYPLYYRSFAQDPLFNYQTQVRKAHNDYLQLAAECGIPALLFFLLLWGRQFYLLRYATPAADDGEDWRPPLLASLTAFSVIMFFSFPMQMAYSRMFCFFLLALGEARAWPALSK